MAHAAIVARSSSDAPADAASSRIRSVSSRMSAGSFFVQSAIAAAQESVIPPVASASARCLRWPNCRIWRTAARASRLVSWAFAASQAEEEPYPSALCASAASNRRRKSAYAAASFAWMPPSAISTSPHAAPSSPAAAGEFR